MGTHLHVSPPPRANRSRAVSLAGLAGRPRPGISRRARSRARICHTLTRRRRQRAQTGSIGLPARRRGSARPNACPRRAASTASATPPSLSPICRANRRLASRCRVCRSKRHARWRNDGGLPDRHSRSTLGVRSRIRQSKCTERPCRALTSTTRDGVRAQPTARPDPTSWSLPLERTLYRRRFRRRRRTRGSQSATRSARWLHTARTGHSAAPRGPSSKRLARSRSRSSGLKRRRPRWSRPLRAISSPPRLRRAESGSPSRHRPARALSANLFRRITPAQEARSRCRSSQNRPADLSGSHPWFARKQRRRITAPIAMTIRTWHRHLHRT